MVYNLAVNYVQHTEDAQEITQDVFVSVYRSMDKFENRASISTWIYRITINRCLDVLKARKRKKRLGFLVSIFDSTAVADPPSFDHPGIKMEQKEVMRQLFDYINELPPNQKTALLLTKTEQMSQADVAEIMGITPKAVESLVQRAKANLTARLSKNEGKK